MKCRLLIFIIVIALIIMTIVYAITRPNYEEIEYEDLGLSGDGLEGLENSLLCIGFSENSPSEFIVNTQAEYEFLINYRNPYGFCDNYVLPQIDMSQRTLLAKFTSGGGCNIEFKKEIFKDSEDKKIIFSIKVIERGSCAKAGSSMNWISIPKVPQDYEVKFIVT